MDERESLLIKGKKTSDPFPLYCIAPNRSEIDRSRWTVLIGAEVKACWEPKELNAMFLEATGSPMSVNDLILIGLFDVAAKMEPIARARKNVYCSRIRRL
jgi:hypothetical protein